MADVKKINAEILRLKGHILASKKSLKQFLQLYEQEKRLEEHLHAYTFLKYDEDNSNTKNLANKQKIESFLRQMSDNESFILKELTAKDYNEVELLLKEDLAKYQLYFKRLYRDKERILSDQEEIIITKALNTFGTPKNAFGALDTPDAKFKNIYLPDGSTKEVTLYNRRTLQENTNQGVRKRVFKSFFNYYDNHKNTFAALLKGNYQELEFLRDIRNYDSALSMALDKSNIPLKIYEKLIENVHKHMDINIEYQKIRAKALGNAEYHLYDIYAPIVPSLVKTFTKDEGIAIANEALKPLGKEYLKNFNKIINNQSVDFYPNKYKHSTGYHYYACYDSLNYVLLNYTGTYSSLLTLVHELGHAVHSSFSKENNPYFYYQHDIFIGEIASNVNETLLSFHFFSKAETREEKIFYLSLFLKRVRETIFRQTMFAEFENIMSKKCQNNEALTEEVFSNTYYKLNEEYFKDSVIIDPEIRYEWMYISHFYRPFYVYKYATGLISAICIVKDILEHKKAADKYLDFLKSGSSKDVLDILKIVDIDLTTNEAYEKAFTFINDCLERLKEEL